MSSTNANTQGYALCVGLNAVDPAHYDGWDGQLNACEADAKDMSAIATKRGFHVQTLLTKDATRDAVLSQLEEYADEAKAGDFVLYTISSHGGQVPDTNGDEADGADETNCLYDGQIIDDEYYELWGKFAEGVRILMVSDSCHSGTITREFHPLNTYSEISDRPKHMPRDVGRRTYEANKDFYDDLQANKTTPDVKASVLLLAGCQDNQTSMDGSFNGAFTGALKRVWANGAFTGCYTTFYRRILHAMPATQTPNLFWATPRNVDFELQTPFRI